MASEPESQKDLIRRTVAARFLLTYVKAVFAGSEKCGWAAVSPSVTQ